jgi:hypothetical protein
LILRKKFVSRGQGVCASMHLHAGLAEGMPIFTHSALSVTISPFRPCGENETFLGFDYRPLSPNSCNILEKEFLAKLKNRDPPCFYERKSSDKNIGSISSNGETVDNLMGAEDV